MILSFSRWSSAKERASPTGGWGLNALCELSRRQLTGPALGGSRPSAPSHFTSGSARICGSSTEQESHSRKEPHCECGSERRAQHPQEIVGPGRLDARRAIELIYLVRVHHF